MKICVLTSGHSPLDDRIFYKEVLSLKKIYHDITIIAPSDEVFTEVEGIKILGIYKRRNSSIKERLKVLKELYKKALEINADVYHCHEPDSLYIGYKMKKIKGSKLIYDSHEYHPEAFSERVPVIVMPIFKKIIYTCERHIASKCDYIITVNEILVNKFKVYNKNTIELPNYPIIYDDNNIDNKDIKNMVYIGGISEERGCSKIINSLELCNNKFEMVFIGGGEEKYLKELELLTKNKQIEHNIKFTGNLPHIEAGNILKKQSIGFVLLQPDNWRYINSQPIKLFEYMVNEIAIIASNYLMIKCILDEEQCGITVDPTNKIEISNAINYLLNNPDEVKKMGQRGRQAVLNKYNWNAIEYKLIEVYNNLAIN